ncbi:hypothetical protein [Rhizobium sp. Leaf383]|uniref:hypothetical protein n=1 Tax=Rhizobium sp. Leaf383 TaxID=1736357 RepID=UPI0007131CE0|nr:hypothetical protein [Rhizobium sp. Leaf383]KQS74517.1 hypothetical protein ASG58_16265 [Rhizobium sp. Leaf383]
MTRGGDMPNGTFDPETKYVQLGERVDNQARQLADVDLRMRQGFTDIASQLRGLADDVRGGSKTQWPLIIGFMSVTITVLGGLGFLALQPIKDNILQIREDARTEASNMKDSLSSVVQAMVTQKEMEWRTGRGIEDRSRMEAAIKDIRDGLVPRAEHERVWRNNDQQLAQIQKQIDELKAGQASTYSARDVILDLRERLDRVEQSRPLYTPPAR